MLYFAALFEWYPFTVRFIAFAVLVFIAVSTKGAFVKNKNNFSKILYISLLVILVLYSLSLSYFQYFVWSRDVVASILLNQPLDLSIPYAQLFNFLGKITGTSSGYFYFYAFTRFWLNLIISIALSVLLIIIIRIWSKVKARDISSTLGFNLAVGFLICGWPRLILFLFLTLFLAVLWHLLKKRASISEVDFTFPIIFAILLILCFGSSFEILTGLYILRI